MTAHTAHRTITYLASAGLWAVIIAAGALIIGADPSLVATRLVQALLWLGIAALVVGCVRSEAARKEDEQRISERLERLVGQIGGDR